MSPFLWTRYFDDNYDRFDKNRKLKGFINYEK